MTVTAVGAKTTGLATTHRCLLFVGRRCCETLLPFPFEWQRIIATTVLAPRCINRGIGPRRFCRATPPTIPDRQLVPARWGHLLDRSGSVRLLHALLQLSLPRSCRLAGDSEF